jgi:hypothetical protein
LFAFLSVIIFSAIGTSADKPKAPLPFIVATADGKSLTGPLRELKADWSLHTGDADENHLSPGDWLALTRKDIKLPPNPSGPHLILLNGDRIPFDSIRLDGETLYFKHADLGDGKENRVPLTAVAVVWLAAPDNIDTPDRYRRLLARATRAHDRALLRNGDALEGMLNTLNGRTAEVEVDKKLVEVATDKLAAIALGTDIVNTLKPKGVYARVTLLGDTKTHGTRLSLASAFCTDGRILEGKTVFGSTLRVPLDRVAALDVYQGRANYLSDMKPARFEFTPYLGDGGTVYPVVTDGSVANRDLRLGGSTYDKGIGLHSRSRLTYDLAGGYRRFEAVVGLDDETGRDGSVRIRVLGDGKPLDLGPDRELTAKSGPLTVSVGVAGVKELILEVDFGQHADVQDDVDWCAARLIK